MIPHGNHPDDRLADLALGTLDDGERAEVLAHVGGCARCTLELRSVRELLSALPLGGAPVTPDPALRRRLLESTARGRLHRFAGRVADLLGIAVARAEHWLDRVDEAAGWQPLPVGRGGIDFLVPEHHGRLDGCAVAFLRIKPGAQFPMHGHLAGEKVLILQGGYVDDISGVEYGPGDVHVCAPGSSHSYTGVDGPDCICLGVVEGKIDVGGVVLGG